MFPLRVLFHGLNGRRSRCANTALRASSGACQRLAIWLRRRHQQDFHGVLWQRLLVPGSCMAGDGRWMMEPCLRSRVLVSGGSDTASLVWYDACNLGADHSCPVTRSQWNGDKYLHYLIPVSKWRGAWVCSGSGWILLRRRRLSCWLAGWSDEGSGEYQGTSSPVFNFFGRTHSTYDDADRD